MLRKGPDYSANSFWNQDRLFTLAHTWFLCQLADSTFPASDKCTCAVLHVMPCCTSPRWHPLSVMYREKCSGCAAFPQAALLSSVGCVNNIFSIASLSIKDEPQIMMLAVLSSGFQPKIFSSATESSPYVPSNAHWRAFLSDSKG